MTSSPGVPAAKPRAANQFLLSFLARQSMLLHHRFVQLHRSPWLVWEPDAGSAQVVVALNARETSLPGSQPNRSVGAGDALCFELAREFLDQTVRWHVGRNTSSEIVVATTPPPSAYCTLIHARDEWRIEASSELAAVKVSGGTLARGVSVPLVDGADLDLDGLRLVFLGPDTFAERVQARAAKL